MGTANIYYLCMYMCSLQRCVPIESVGETTLTHSYSETLMHSYHLNEEMTLRQSTCSF